MLYMFSKIVLNKYQYIIDIYHNTLYIADDIVWFRFRYFSRCEHAHWDQIVPEFSKCGKNGRHVFTLVQKLYCIVSYINTQCGSILEYFRFLYLFTCSSHSIRIYLQLLVKSVIVCYEPYSTFCLGIMNKVMPYSDCYIGVSITIYTEWSILLKYPCWL